LRRIGELRILAGAGQPLAEAALREGLDMAIEQGARALAVRGAISLARLRAGLGDRDGALDLLAPYADGPLEWMRKADVGTAQQLAATLRAGDDLADAVAPGILASGIAG
jgi:ATP/maltotriose-dependent transcriptional regulator MalT